jgi:hypothetical protein
VLADPAADRMETVKVVRNGAPCAPATPTAGTFSLDPVPASWLPPIGRTALPGPLLDEVPTSAAEVRFTYRVPPAVRLPDGMVEMRGLEPLTPSLQRRCSPS